VHPVAKLRELLSGVPTTSVDKILGANASKFFGVS
jgi:hypothetical protein